MRLDVKAFAISLGILWGVTVFALTLVCHHFDAGETLVRLGRLYPQYAISVRGAVLGLFWGFVHAAASGAALAALYNAFLPAETATSTPKPGPGASS
jgi:hypothetical protein